MLSFQHGKNTMRSTLKQRIRGVKGSETETYT